MARLRLFRAPRAECERPAKLYGVAQAYQVWRASSERGTTRPTGATEPGRARTHPIVSLSGGGLPAYAPAPQSPSSPTRIWRPISQAVGTRGSTIRRAHEANALGRISRPAVARERELPARARVAIAREDPPGLLVWKARDPARGRPPPGRPTQPRRRRCIPRGACQQRDRREAGSPPSAPARQSPRSPFGTDGALDQSLLLTTPISGGVSSEALLFLPITGCRPPVAFPASTWGAAAKMMTTRPVPMR